MKKIKYGIIGAGTMAREHILNISLIDNAEVVALADPHEDSLNQCKEILKTKVFCFKNHLEMIEKNIVDVYLISSPNFTHIEILKDVIKTKKHILVEKPLCTNTKHCLEIKKLTQEKEKKRLFRILHQRYSFQTIFQAHDTLQFFHHLKLFEERF